MNWIWEKTKTIRCADNSERQIYKNIDDACPLVISGWKADVAADIKGLDQLAGTAKANYESKIEGLLFNLNEQNQSLMMCFRSVYLFYSSNPCENDAFFQREIEKLIDEQRKISALKIQIEFLIQLATQNPSNITEITEVFSKIASSMGGPAIAEAASLEITQAREVAQEVLGVTK